MSRVSCVTSTVLVRREIRVRALTPRKARTMEKPKWADHLQPIGVYYERILDDASAVVEILTVETSSTFAQGDPDNSNRQVCKENITVNCQDDEVSYVIQRTEIQQQRTNAVYNMKSQHMNDKQLLKNKKI